MKISQRLSVLAWLFLSATAVQADPPRTITRGTPTILGRELDRFVLVQPIDIDRAGPGMTKGDVATRMRCRVLPGQLVPVSEDATGVYYQAANGVQPVGHRTASDGGLMVSKAKEGVIFAYLGDARELQETLFRDPFKLSKLEVAKLKSAAPSALARRASNADVTC